MAGHLGLCEWAVKPEGEIKVEGQKEYQTENVGLLWWENEAGAELHEAWHVVN